MTSFLLAAALASAPMIPSYQIARNKNMQVLRFHDREKGAVCYVAIAIFAKDRIPTIACIPEKEEK